MAKPVRFAPALITLAAVTASALSARADALPNSQRASSIPANSGALSVLPSNPFYFQDARGRPVVLVGDYTWGTFSDVNYDYIRFFDSLRARGLNVARVWLWWGCEEITTDPIPARHIEPYLRPGPGNANDGRPKYDLARFNPAFFSRLTAFCRAAQQRGIQLQLMAMDAWMIKHPELWKLHAFQRDNNVNGVDGDPTRTGVGTDGRRGFCSMRNPRAMAFQKALVRKIVETTNGFDNVHYEIANENYYSAEWELALCDTIKEIEKTMPRRHLVMRRDLPLHSDVMQSWDPATVRRGMLAKRSLNQPLIFDTDWVINKDDREVRTAMWTALVSGGHFDYMDDSLEFRVGKPLKDERERLHKQIDYAAAFMKRIKPWEMMPDDALVKSGTAYAMASKGELAAYLPRGGSISLDLSRIDGSLEARWYNPLDGKYAKPIAVRPGRTFELTAPDTNDWALLITRKASR